MLHLLDESGSLLLPKTAVCFCFPCSVTNQIVSVLFSLCDGQILICCFLFVWGSFCYKFVYLQTFIMYKAYLHMHTS